MRAMILISDIVFLSPIVLPLSVDEFQVDILKRDASYGIFRQSSLLNDFLNYVEISGIVNDSLIAYTRGGRAHSVVDQTICFWHGPIEILEGPEPFEFSSLQDTDAIGE